MLADPELWVAIAFVVFVLLILWKGTKPILAALDARGIRIRGQIEEAQALRREAEQALAEAERKVRDAIREAEAIVAHGREEALRLKEQATESLETSLKRREQNALDKIAQAESRAVQEVRARATEVAIAATAAILREEMTGPRGDRLIEESIAEIGRRLN